MAHRPIRGGQYPPQNNAQPECIKVKKVYDWTIVSANTEQLFTVPPDCLERIRNITNLRIKCCPPTDLLPPSDPAQICSIKRNIPGLPSSAALVTIRCHNIFKLLFFDGNNPDCPGSSLCCVQGSIPIVVKDVVLCLPEPLNGNHVTCGVISCDGCGVLIGDEVEIDLTVCMDIQVELDVKLEVVAKFCQPRLPITPPVTTCPIEVPFPPQCDFFPKQNCDCNAQVIRNGTPDVPATFIGSLTPTLGTASLETTICPFCTLQESSLTFSYTEDIPYMSPTNESFTLTADPGSFQQPSCTFTPGTTTFSIVGAGFLFKPETGVTTPNTAFTLSLQIMGGVCQYTLTIPSILAIPISVSSVTDPSLCSIFTISDCVRLDQF